MHDVVFPWRTDVLHAELLYEHVKQLRNVSICQNTSVFHDCICTIIFVSIV